MASLTYTFFTLALALLPFALLEADALNYASVKSADGNFELKWAYSNNMLMFNMTCKATGWCAVAFTTNPGGRNMVKYDIAVGGVNSNTPYLDDYWSAGKGTPTKDGSQDYKLLRAMEEGGKTYVDFYRNATTTESNNDVQFMNNTEVYIAWAFHASNDGDAGLAKHTATGVFNTTKRNLIMEAMDAGKSTTAPTTRAELKYVSVESDNGDFQLKWAYSNDMLMFNMTCKATGWCAVAFTTNPGGRNMVNYDIAVGGFASGMGYLDDHWSAGKGNPPKGESQDYKLIRAMEDGGKTYVDFYRNATTTENVKDVQFMSNTEVYIAWALHASADANSGLTMHTATGVFTTKRNLIMETMNAGSSTTSTTAKTTTTNAASEASSRVMAFAILALTACVLSL